MASDRPTAADGRPSGRRLAAPAMIFAAVVLAVLFAGSADAPAVDGISTPQRIDPPLPTGAIPDLDLLFTAEVAGWIEPCG